MKTLLLSILLFLVPEKREPVSIIPPGQMVILLDYSGYNFYPQQWEPSFSAVVGMRVKSLGTDVITDVSTGEKFYMMSFVDRFGAVLPVVYWPANKVRLVLN